MIFFRNKYKTLYHEALKRNENQVETIGQLRSQIMQLQMSKADLIGNLKQLQADKNALIDEKLQAQNIHLPTPGDDQFIL